MRFSVTVADGASGQSQSVLIDADPDHTITDLLPQLINSTEGAGMHPSFAVRVGVWVDGRTVDGTATLREADLRPGSVLALHEPHGNRAGLPRGVAEIRVVSGPGAGRVHRIGLGETVIGCGASALSLPDVMLPADALTLGVSIDGSVTVTSGKGVEAFLEDKLLDGTTTWPPAAYVRSGGTALELVPPWEPDADVSPSDDRLGVDFNRPPRLLPAPREHSFTLPGEPAQPRKMSFPWVMVLAPMLLAIPMAFIFGPRYLLMGLMSPMMALFNVVSGKRQGVRQFKEDKAQYDEDLATVQARLTVALETERSDRRNAIPDPAQVLLNAVGPGGRLWERRRSDPDYLSWRLGLADRPSVVSVTDRNVKDFDEKPERRVVNDVPVVMSLRDNGVVGVAGEPEIAEAVARWLIGQTAVLHSPRDVRLVLIAGPEGERRWGWTRWLPHCRVEDEAIPAMLGTEQESIGRRVGEMSNLIAERLAAMDGPSRSKATPVPDYIVILDGARRLRALPGIVTLLRDGPRVGVTVLCLDDDERSLPEECRAIIRCSTDGLTLHQTMAEDVRGIRADQVETAWTDRIGRALAPVRDATPSEDDAGLPRSARLLECIGLPDPTPDSIIAGWTDQVSTEVVIGTGFDGPFRLDLRRDGPHALIAGTTGSGKSELLQTIVASLAVANRPDQLTFVLVDYKGGSAFKECNKLPHTVGMVTDLDTHLVGRALTSLGAELRRREHLLAVPGAKDLEDYAALRRNDPGLPTIPRLALVIDEFASLKAELPDFVTGLVTIAQRGRSLGIHLILATQRPSGVVSADIRANTNLRIALRVTDESESRDVIDSPESGRIAANTPGRGYARLGPSAVLPFQTARVGGRRPGVKAASQAQLKAPLVWPIPWARVGLPAPSRPRPQGSDTDEGETDLSVLVTAIKDAEARVGIEKQHSPWLPALPKVVTLARVRELQLERDPEAATRHTCVPWALEDRPGDQDQIARTFTLGKDGHLFLIGGARSGRSTALRTIAGALAQSVRARDLNIYGLDCGNGALLPLTTLPHTGAVVQRSEVERASRLLDRLTDEVTRRQGVLGRNGFANIDEQRDAAAPDEKLPYVVLFLDRWEGFMSDLSDLDLGRLLDSMTALLREGASVGVHVIMSGDRTLLNGRVASMVEHKFVMRLPDRSDYTSAGLRPKEMPQNLGDGRGLWADIAIEAQIAVLSEDTSGAGQSAALRAIAASVAERDADVPVALQPVRLGVLPASVEASQVLPRLDPARLPAMFVPLGIGGDRLELLGIDLSSSPVAVVAGPPRSGRTNTLQMLAAYGALTGRGVLGFTPRENALTSTLGAARCVVGVGQEPEAVVALLRQLGSGSLILVDDAEALREGPMAAVMAAVVAQARERGFGVIIAGQNQDLSGGFSGWIYEARKARQGIVLSPQEALAGDLFGGRIQRTSLQARIAPGRAVLFDGTGDQMLIQVPKVS